MSWAMRINLDRHVQVVEYTLTEKSGQEKSGHPSIFPREKSRKVSKKSQDTHQFSLEKSQDTHQFSLNLSD
jgi:hypothetical protein